MLKDKKTILALLLVPLYLLVELLRLFPEFVEWFYSHGVYVCISKSLRYTWGWLPFSFGDLVYLTVVIYLLRWLVINRKRMVYRTKNWLKDLFATATIIYAAFHLFWGLNYHRLPLHKQLNLQSNYSTEQLVSVTKRLIKKSNASHLALTHNDTQKVVMPFSKNEILNLSAEGFNTIKHLFPYLEYPKKSLKKSLFSRPLSYMGFSGYLNPLTNEAQVNALIPAYSLPITASHEIAHQLGYAAENEANFIACLATINHSNHYFNYVGYTAALRFCIIELSKTKPRLFQELMADINPGILKNYKEVRLFWRAYQNPIEPFFKIFYDGYLKANNQIKGINSYSYVVGLLTNYLDQNSL